MTKKFRRRLFYLLLIIFLITGVGAVFYSRGWRLNLEKFTIEKTGAIYIQAKPKEVQLEIENKPIKTQGGILQKGFLIDGLIPKIYSITIKKEGYFSWQKEVKVEPDLVTELTQIILIPKEISSTPIDLQKPVKDFWLLPNRKTVIRDNEGSLYYVDDYLKTNVQKLKGVDLIHWDNDGKKIITYDPQSNNFYLEDPTASQTVLNINVLFKNIWQREINQSFSKVKIQGVILHPYRSNNLLLNTNQGIYIIDIDQLSLKNLTEEKLLGKAYAFDFSNFYFADEEKLWVFNLILKSQKLLAEIPLVSKIVISNSHKYLALLQENGNLYLMRPFEFEKSPQKIAEGIKDFLFSPDSKKIALWDQEGDLNIYFPEKYYYGSFKKEKGALVNLTNFSDFKKVAWYSDSSHLIVQNNQTIYFLEIDDRPPINKFPLANSIKNFFYDSGLGEFLLLKDKDLSRLIL